MSSIGPQTFSVQLARFAEIAELRVDDIVRKVAIDMLGRIVLRTPVDTGRARANWVVSIGARTTLISRDAADPTGRTTIEKGTRLLLGYQSSITVAWISNGLPYILPLEYGSSKQAPAGMVRLTVQEFRGMVDRAVQEARGK